MSFRLTLLQLPTLEYSDTTQFTFDQKSTRNYVKLYKKIIFKADYCDKGSLH
jgi:hypothetical protein